MEHTVHLCLKKAEEEGHDNATKRCFASFRRISCRSFVNVVRSGVSSNGESAHGPGVRGGASGAGGPLPSLTADESAFFKDGLARFAEIEVVTEAPTMDLGLASNSNQCLSCHSQPAGGGSSPARNHAIAIATLNGARNVAPWFITQNGPVREARFKRTPNGTNDGEVHAVFVITGRSDAAGCNIAQPNFLPAGNPLSGQGEIRILFSAFRRRSLALGLSKQSRTRRSSRT